MYGYIYVTTNLQNNRKYIGKHKCSIDKINNNYLGSGKLLKQAIAKYGIGSFSKFIIDIAYDEKDLNTKEKYWISKFNACESRQYYNIASGGNGGYLIAGYDEETRKRILKNFINYQSGKPGVNTGRVLDSNWRANIGKKSKQSWDSRDKEKYWNKYKSNNRSKKFELGDTIPHYKFDEDLVIIQYNKDTLDVEKVYFGVSEFFDKYNTNATRYLHDAIKLSKLYRKSYWKAMSSSQSTIEITPKRWKKVE